MPTLTTEGGKPVDVTPVDAEAVNAAFSQAMNEDGPDEQAPPKRAPKQAAGEKPRARASKGEKSRTTAAASVPLTDAQRASAVKGYAQFAAVPALMAAKATGNAAFAADAVTISNAAPHIAEACVEVARNDARFAAALDKVCAAGPYAALIGIAFSVGAQCMRNHKPALALPGTVHPDELLKESNDGEAFAAAA